MTVLFSVTLSRKDGTPIGPEAVDSLLSLHDSDDIIFAISETPVWAGRTAIQSTAALTYQQGHNLVQGLSPDHGQPPGRVVPAGQAGRPVHDSLCPQLAADLKVLTVVSRFLMQSRFKNHALDLKRSEGGQLSFKLGQEGKPLEIHGHDDLEIHDTIAELMILANSSVAAMIRVQCPDSTMIRSHAPPTDNKLKDLRAITSETGLDLFSVGGGEEKTQAELFEYKEKLLQISAGGSCKGKGKGKGGSKSVVNYITSEVIKSMTEAQYACSKDTSVSTVLSQRHYGLGLANYTHFTSPIRRYADIVVHRQLLYVISLCF